MHRTSLFPRPGALSLLIVLLFLALYAAPHSFAREAVDDGFLEAAPARDVYGLSTKKVTLTILYSAASHGEFRPCPT